jgi:hypothetical protein
MTHPLPFRPRPDLDDSLDPELTSLFGGAAAELEPSPLSLDRAQAKVAARL